jgi:hypothetical protein
MPQMSVPAYLTKQQLIDVLIDVLNVVCADDSFEGSLSYEFPWNQAHGDPVTDPSPNGFRVRASYRIGNSMGQGGLRTIGEMREVTADGVVK